MKIAYCGYSRAGQECLYRLLNRKVACADIQVFTHDTPENNEFVAHLKSLGINYTFQPINDCYDAIAALKPDFLISVYYRFIISSKILQCVTGNSMNLHPSLLPKYRGTKSSVWALINGESHTGISFHVINERVDDGHILLSEKAEILETDTAFSLYHKLVSLFVENFDSAFNLLVEGYAGKPQVGQPTYYRRELPFGGKRNFSDVTYEEASRYVRAMFFPPFKGAIFELPNLKTVEVLDVKDLVRYKDLMKEG